MATCSDHTVTVHAATGASACPPLPRDLLDAAAQLFVTVDRLFGDLPWWTPVRHGGLEAARDLLATPWWAWAAARDTGGTLVGFAAIAERGGTLYLSKVMVSPHCRRTGVTTSVCRALLAVADDAHRAVTLEVMLRSPDAVRLYHHLGFTPCGLTQLDRPGFECLVMHRSGLHGPRIG